jgi:flagella basal body P-ring formation protein FlgA
MARGLLDMSHMNPAPIFRRGVLLHCLRSAALALIPLCSNAADPGTAEPPSPYQDIAQLEALARSEAMREFPPLTERQRFVVGPIEPRLELAKCRTPVRSFLSSAHHMKDRATIELRCEDTKVWHLFVQVRIVGTSPVAVAVHAIVAGSVLKAGDLRVEEHDISDLPLGFMDDPAVAVGLTASRPIAGGAYITNQQLVAPKAVLRGQLVTLVADTGGVTIRMAGRALGDGLVNQRIKVTNLSSGRVVEGIARSEQVVEIVLQ